jgi:hypothetical protein
MPSMLAISYNYGKVSSHRISFSQVNQLSHSQQLIAQNLQSMKATKASDFRTSSGESGAASASAAH